MKTKAASKKKNKAAPKKKASLFKYLRPVLHFLFLALPLMEASRNRKNQESLDRNA